MLKKYVSHCIPLTHLLEPEKRGRLHGRCAFCFHETREGFPLKKSVSQAFTDYSELHASNVVCPYCYMFLKDPRFRRSSWVIAPKNIVFLKREEVAKYIADPPDPPYAIYVTRSFKKHGWIKMMYRGVNYSKEFMAVGFDADLVFFKRRDFLELLDHIQAAVKRGVSKKRLLAKAFTPSDLEKLGPEEYRYLVSKWGGLDYELAVYLS